MLSRRTTTKGWQLLYCLRFSILDLLLSLEVHMEKVILAWENELMKFADLMEFILLSSKLAENQSEKVKEWNFHKFNDIETKSASRNYNTGPNRQTRHGHTSCIGDGRRHERGPDTGTTYWFLPGTPIDSTQWLITSKKKNFCARLAAWLTVILQYDFSSAPGCTRVESQDNDKVVQVLLPVDLPLITYFHRPV
ncbi:hypothetical protein EDB92DRAFT_1818262 [Lactarius akahatsu]|uniref:Uncharacterized protein n=1 Tax=Lactarius akahatsu TaxID=416441 RepID=A0AAD4LBD3_9AGAM|nr:hypothetical protein EDB92DRAFT_1818262 [Lactarius akahatsu]